MRRRSAGRFVVLEGIDGSGTTTQLGRLAEALRARGHRVVTTREPSDGPVGVLLRQALTRRVTDLPDAALALLFAADRLDHLAAVVEPAVASGALVLSDRYVLSSFAYQGVRLPLAWVEVLNARAWVPDLTLFLRVPPAAARARRHARGGAPELFEADPVQQAVARAYGRLARRHARTQHVRVVDGTGTPEEVTEALLAAVAPVLPRPTRAGGSRSRGSAAAG